MAPVPVRALDGVSLDIRDREFFTLLGPSGCGKTTLLRLIAGFEAPTAGRSCAVTASHRALPPNRRPVNTVFQHYALFPHMTVAENVGVRPEDAGAAARGGRGDRRPDAGAGAARRARRPAARPALGRPAAARGAGPGAGAAARRCCCSTSRSPRSTSSCARRCRSSSSGCSEETGHHLHLRHPRPGGGARHVGPHRGHGRGPGPAGRRAADDLRPAGRPFRRQLHRRDQLPGRPRVEAGADGRARCAPTRAASWRPSPAGARPGRQVTLSIRPERLLLRADGAGRTGLSGMVERMVYLGTDTHYRVRVGELAGARAGAERARRAGRLRAGRAGAARARPGCRAGAGD